MSEVERLLRRFGFVSLANDAGFLIWLDVTGTDLDVIVSLDDQDPQTIAENWPDYQRWMSDLHQRYLAEAV